MTKPIVLLDVDGPLAAFTAAFLRAVKQEIGVSISVDEIDRWSIHQTTAFLSAAELAGVTPAELKRAVEARVSRPGFCSAIDVQPGAVEAVATLKQLAEVYVVTSPWNSCPTWTHEREAWLGDHFGIHHTKVRHVYEKHDLRGDILIDDNAGHCRDWSAQWPDGTAVLYALPSNQYDGDGLTRGGWIDVIEAVTKRREKAA